MELEKSLSGETSLRQQYYRRYAKDIGEVFDHCGCPLDEDTEEAFSLLTRATESVDRMIDDASAEAQRKEYRMTVLSVMDGCESSSLPNTVGSDVSDLRICLLKRNCLTEVKAAIKGMFDLQEDMRTTERVDRYIHLSLEEGHGLADLVLSVAHEKTNATVRRVSHLMGSVANLTDHVFDAQRDFENGEIAFRPDAHFYVRGIARCAYGLGALVAAYPDKKKGFSFLVQRFKNAWRTRQYAIKEPSESKR